MKYCINFIFIVLFSHFSLAEVAIETKLPKIDFEGCPENSFCSKLTGINRNLWLNTIKSLQSGKISEKSANELILKNEGFPIAAWGTENALKAEFMYWWDSPCKQHKAPNEKYYVGEVFTKSLNEEYTKNHPELYFAKAIIKEGNEYKTISVPRGDSPLAIINGQFYYTKDDEGNFYGLNISKTGGISISKTKRITNFPKEVECPKEMSADFYRSAPHLNFYKGHFCKEIWDQNQKAYQIYLMGWSCN